MIVLGCDVSSSSTGLARVRGDDLLDYAVWTPPKKASRPAAILEYEQSLDKWLEGKEIDMAVVEEPGGGGLGFRTIRSMAHFESITYLVLERRKIIIVVVKAGHARNLVLGMKITASKEEAHAEVKRRWPGLKLPPANRGGPDVADAFVQAKAGPEFLRR